jgi:hypothetical protein
MLFSIYFLLHFSDQTNFEHFPSIIGQNVSRTFKVGENMNILVKIVTSILSYYFTFKDSCISPNCSKADSRFSTFSPAIISGAGRFSESSRVSSLSQKISKLTLFLFMSSSYVKDLNLSVSFLSRFAFYAITYCRISN